MAGEDDVDLLTAIAERRDADALAALYDRYSSQALGLASRLLGDRGAAEDVVQEAFFRVWRCADSYSSERGGVRAWLLSVVRNLAVDKLRRRQSRERLDIDLDRTASPLEQSDVWDDVATHLERQLLAGALQELPSSQRAAIALAYFGGLSHSEIANRLRVPLGTVKGRLRLGMEKLRTALTEEQLADS
jgi:RNA polymerase sigma-70 factor (ECF subfamily)